MVRMIKDLMGDDGFFFRIFFSIIANSYQCCQEECIETTQHVINVFPLLVEFVDQFVF